MYQEDTIAAIATGMTESGIGIIRISGKDSVASGNQIFRTISGKKILDKVESHTFHHGYILDDRSIEMDDRKNHDWKNHIIDEVMIVVMRGPRSYTCGIWRVQQESVFKWKDGSVKSRGSDGCYPFPE